MYGNSYIDTTNRITTKIGSPEKDNCSLFLRAKITKGGRIMATHRMPVLGSGTIPDSSGDVFFEPYSIKATNDEWNRLVLIFNDTSTRIGMHGGFTIPENFVDNPSLIIVWTSASTGSGIVWDLDYITVGGDDSESLDQFRDAISGVGDSGPTTAHNRMESSIPLYPSYFVANDEVEFKLFRDGTDVGDTLAAAVIVFNILFEYDDA